MNIIFYILIASIIMVIGLMLLRVFQGPTVYDRMNGLGVIGADTILLLVLFGYLDGRQEMYLDMAVSYAMLGFLGSIIIAKLLGGKNI
ncbi:MAG: pH regulation protein F [Phascolarctobacterium sp.]|nr:pH regulation protein F [Candidatus Phascolarctobacterium caballi]